MTREDIIPRTEVLRMAREADLGFLLNENWLMHEELEAFAALVASAAQAKEREACALLCYEQRKHWDALACADAIRAGTRPRGQA